MSRSYINTSLDSIIEEIIVEEASGDLNLRIKLRQSIERSQLKDLSFEPTEDNSRLYVLKDDPSTALSFLEQHGLIDHSFKESIVLNEKNEYQKQMHKLVKRRRYDYPQTENSLIEAVIIQHHNYDEDMAFVSYKKEKEEELYRICKLHQLTLDQMPNVIQFEQYSIICSSTPAMALEGIKRAGIIDEKFKDFILSQEQAIPVEPVVKKINEEDIARRFDCRYDVIADYTLTSNHWFYQPIEEEVPAKYSETMKPTV